MFSKNTHYWHGRHLDKGTQMNCLEVSSDFSFALTCFTQWLGRTSSPMKKIENPSSRQITYSKRRESILKKAAELSMHCETDVGLLMFSPSGRLTTFASKGRVEDMLLRYIEHPDNYSKRPLKNEEYLCESLKHLKYEAEILEKIERLEALEKKLHDLNRQKYEAQDKMRSYKPNVTKILTVQEAQFHQEFVVNAIQRIEKLKNAKMLENEASNSKLKEAEMPTVEVKESDFTTEESANSKRKRNESEGDEKDEAGSSSAPHGPHLSISFLKTQTNWKL